MKKIILIVMLLVSVCGSCFAFQDESIRWVPSNSSKYFFDANFNEVYKNSESIGFNGATVFVLLKKENSSSNFYYFSTFNPQSMNPYLFNVKEMFHYSYSTGKMRKIDPPKVTSFNDPVLARDICNYAGIEIR